MVQLSPFTLPFIVSPRLPFHLSHPSYIYSSFARTLALSFPLLFSLLNRMPCRKFHFGKEEENHPASIHSVHRTQLATTMRNNVPSHLSHCFSISAVIALSTILFLQMYNNRLFKIKKLDINPLLLLNYVNMPILSISNNLTN